MSEKIYKLQPDRTMALRGFDDLGAAAALHSATANSFKVTGVFRDPADFAVLILYDADNFYEHPRLRYLPDFRFDGLMLNFNVRYSGLMTLDSTKYETIDWPYLDYVLADANGTTGTVELFDHATKVSGNYTAAEATFTIVDNGLKQYDRLTLWYLNLAYDYLVPQVECAYLLTARSPGFVHTITVANQTYSYVETATDGNIGVAAGIVAALAACPDVTASRGDNTAESGPLNQVNIRAKRTDGGEFAVNWNNTPHTLTGVSAASVAQNMAAQINATNWNEAGATLRLQAQATGANVRVTVVRPGADGNDLRMYSVAKNGRLTTSADTAVFTGGSSDVTWRVSLDFAQLGLANVRQMWLTFAPPIAYGKAFPDTEWEALFTDWTVTGPEERRLLQVAGPRSVRVEEHDSWCKYTGAWVDETGFFSDGYAKRASAPDATVTVRYSCGSPHHLYLGTSLYTDRATVAVQVDNNPEWTLNCKLKNEPAVNTRRNIPGLFPPGEHVVKIRVISPGHFYFDFLEAVVPSDVPDRLPARLNLSPALDYSTDHTYKLSPSRLLWIFDGLGYAGPMNEYLGVFWWNQRKRVNAVLPSVSVTFSNEFVPGDQVFLDVGGQVCGKTVFPAEAPEIIARHFEFFINADYVGVWAKATGPVLTITARSPKPAYAFTFNAWTKKATGSNVAIAYTGALDNGAAGSWIVDPDQSPALNRGAQAWHRDFFRLCAARDREVVVAASMELVNPPEGFAAVYPDGGIVETSVGFGSLKSTHCSFVQPVRDYQSAVFACVANWMAEEGLTPAVQFGEHLWWFFSNRDAEHPNGGMALYHPETEAAALAALGRPLHRFRQPTDDPGVNAYADATFLRNVLRDHAAAIAAHVRSVRPGTRIELLFPYDVNHPVPAGVHSLGGPLNRFLNLPAEWETKPTSPFDRIKMEALDFGAWSRNLDLARTAIEFPLALGWPRDSVRHLVPVFRFGYAWEKEIAIATGAGIPFVNLWAFDHVCIYNLPPVPEGKGRSMRL